MPSENTLRTFQDSTNLDPTVGDLWIIVMQLKEMPRGSANARKARTTCQVIDMYQVF